MRKEGVGSSGAVLHAIYAIERQRLGRRRLAAAIGSTEMATRLELERLRDAGHVELTRAGPRLTAAGRRSFRFLFDAVLEVLPLTLATLRIDEGCVTARLSGTTAPPAWEARDAALRAGASGLLVLVRASNAWAFAHDNEPVALRNGEAAATLEEAFAHSTPGEHLLISFGPDHAAAARGLWGLLAEILNRSA